MLPLVEQHREQLARLCAKYGVRRLDLFGSAASGTFDLQSSDLDLLVMFRSDDQFNPADRYLGLLQELESLFGRKVDLVDVRAARNPYFIAEALKKRVLLYAP